MGDVGRISAVIVNFNVRTHLLECVRSLRADGVDDIVVADNASTDGSLDALIDSDPNVVTVPTGGNLGFGAAANRGVAAASGDVIVVMNPDTVVQPGAMKALGAALEHDPKMAVVGPRVETLDGRIYPSARTFPNLAEAGGHAFLGFVAPGNRFTRRYKMLDWDHASARQVDWVSGTCMAMRREVFDAIGGFDEGYFMYVEDVDLCWRCRQRGWSVAYEPAARIVHAIGRSTELTPYRMIAAHHRSLLRFSARTATGSRRLAVPVVAAALGGRTLLAWVQRAFRKRPHAMQ